MRRKLAELRERNALACEEAFHSIRAPAAVAPREQEFAVDLAAILFNRRRDIDDTPHLFLAAFGPDVHRHELGGVEPIRLRASAAPVDFDPRGVDDSMRDATTHQIPMQPEPIPPGFVATAHGRGGRQSEVRLRSRDLCLERLESSRRHLAAQRWLIHASGHRQHPLGVAELERET